MDTIIAGFIGLAIGALFVWFVEAPILTYIFRPETRKYNDWFWVHYWPWHKP